MFPANSSVIYHMVSVGYLQSFFGVYSIRIENVGVRKPPSDDVKITGVAHPHDFRKVFQWLTVPQSILSFLL